MGEIVIAPMIDKRASVRADRLLRARIAGLEEALEIVMVRYRADQGMYMREYWLAPVCQALTKQIDALSQKEK